MSLASNCRRLFFDDTHVRNSRYLIRRFHRAEKYHGNPVIVPDQPWERAVGHNHGTLFLEDGTFKFWYATVAYPHDFENSNVSSMHCAYAESTDGITWHKPDLGLIPVKGSAANNLVFLDVCWANIIHDDHDADPAKRYKMLYYGRGREKPGAINGWLGGAGYWGWCAAYSEDRFHWQPDPDNPVYTGAEDAASLVGWDETQGKYVAYMRPRLAHAVEDETRDQGGRTVPVDASMERFPYTRMIGRTTSENFTDWGVTQTVIPPDESDPPAAEMYNMPVVRYQGWYIGLLYMLYADPAEEKQPRKQGLMDTQLAVSRDGINWTRCGGRQPLIARGGRGEWDVGMVGPNAGLIEKAGKLWFYYSGWTGEHRETKAYRKGGKGKATGLFEMGRLNSGFGLAWLRQDGFVSLEAGEDEAMLETVTEELSGDTDRLVINAVTAPAGYVAAEIVRPDGTPVSGCSAAECDRFNGDSVCHTMAWDGKEATGLEPGPYRVRFRMRNASLYSYQVCAG